MSSSIAAAKRRRGVVEQTPPPTQQPVQRNQQQPPNPTSLTMEQAFQVIGKRLITLETFMKNKLAEDSSMAAPQQQQSTVASTTTQIETLDSTGKVVQMSLKEMLEDFDKRYELLAEEVINIKNIVLDLQAYTMGVNKTLYEKFVANDDINIPEEFVTEPDADADAEEVYTAGTSAGTDLITSLNKLNIKYGSAVNSGYNKSKEMITGIIEM